MNDFSRIGTDLVQASQNLRAQKTRTMLTGLGMVFGVGAVIGMLAISAGAKQQALATIEALGVHNLMVDSIAPGSPQELQARRLTSPGLTMRDVRIIQANLDGLSQLSPRRSLHPQNLMPQPTQAMPALEGVDPSFASIHGFHALEGSFFDQLDNAASAPVAVLGQTAKVSLFGYTAAVGKYIKVNDGWLRVIGVLDEQLSGGATSRDWNNVIYTPLNTFDNRFYDNSFRQKDFLDGVDMSLKPSANSVAAAAVVTAILNSTHHNTDDFNVTVPAALLAQQQQTQRIFTLVMVAVAAISLLVGGIGIMNIVLATVMERTREIGVRRATGARRTDILRQFLAEAVLISLSGGALGILFGYILSWTIAATAHWPTVVTSWSIIIAFGVSVGVGVLFGIYPARKAARIDPIEALRYE
ncbi:MAG: FtsX-like permease family protein [Acidobacteria bacterium]|nr:MAG: FtsX-like permease family protein [Acidobacteriota bacterium]